MRVIALASGRRLVALVVGGIGAVLMMAGCGQIPPAHPSAEQRPVASPAATPHAASPTPQLATPTSPASSPTDPSTPAVQPSSGRVPDPPPTAPATSAKVDCAKAKCIAITFDDGPSAESGELLKALADKNVKATFFVLGKSVEKHPEVVKQMVDEGHVVGNHSYTHPQFWKRSKAAIKSEIKRTSELIQSITGEQVTLMRPPYGQSNKTVRAVERKLKVAQILWSIDPEDWKTKDTKKTIKRVLDHAKPGAIILLHEIYAETRAAVPTLVDKLEAKGFVLVTVPELLGKTKPGVSYSQRK